MAWRGVNSSSLEAEMTVGNMLATARLGSEVVRQEQQSRAVNSRITGKVRNMAKRSGRLSVLSVIGARECQDLSEERRASAQMLCREPSVAGFISTPENPFSAYVSLNSTSAVNR